MWSPLLVQFPFNPTPSKQHYFLLEIVFSIGYWYSRYDFNDLVWKESLVCLPRMNQQDWIFIKHTKLKANSFMQSF